MEHPANSTSSDHEDEESFGSQKLNQFAGAVCNTLKAEELLLTPIQNVKVDFNKVKFEDFTIEEKKKAWKAILSKVCLYKTTTDVIGSFRENPYRVLPPGTSTWNEEVMASDHKHKSKTENHKKKQPYAKVPLCPNEMILMRTNSIVVREEIKRSGYTEFSRKEMSKFTLKEISVLWKEMSAEEKASYAEQARVRYIETMEKYVKEHPEDEGAQSCLDKATKGKTPVKTKNNSKLRKSSESDKTPSPKKKKKKERNTGLSVFISRKKEEYSVENPDLDEETILSKLTRKYSKISNERKEKYNNMAEELNDS